jgi:ribosomal-protein-alanine N-acetyltransferase
MILREWTKTDIPKIAELEKVCFSDPWTEESFENGMTNPFFRGILFEDKGQVCAYACQFVIFEDSEILNIAVAPSHRRQGLGKKLLAEMEEYAKDNGAERMLLEVREGNAPARTLYKAWGFEEFGVRKNYYEDGENAIVMQKQI